MSKDKKKDKKKAKNKDKNKEKNKAKGKVKDKIKGKVKNKSKAKAKVKVNAQDKEKEKEKNKAKEKAKEKEKEKAKEKEKIKEKATKEKEIKEKEIKEKEIEINKEKEKTSKSKSKQIEGLIEKGKRQKRLSYDEINEILPENIYAPEEIEEIFSQLSDLQIAVDDEDDVAFVLHEEEVEEERLALEEVRNPLRSYLKEAGEISLLNHEQEVEIARNIEEIKKDIQDARNRNASNAQLNILDRRLDELKAQLIQANLRLVINIAKKYSNPKLTLRDLIQEGNIGLMKAVDKFRFREGYKFSTYATWWIRQAITRAIADHSSTIRIPVHMREKINKLNKVSRNLVHELDREPTPEEIARKTQTSPDKVRMILKSMQREPISLETPVGDDEKTTFGDFIEDRDTDTPASAATYALLQEELEKIFAQLDEREEKILKLRFGIGVGYPRTLEEVGQFFNLTRERIRQIESKALEKLRVSNQLTRLASFLRWYRSSA